MSKSKVVQYTIPTSSDQNERIEHYLDQQDLEGMKPYYKKYAEDNIKNSGTPKDFFEALLEKNQIFKKTKQTTSRVLKAGFGKEKTLESFNFKAENLKNINERQIRDLANSTFIKDMKNILIIGDSKLGKTHIAKALARKAIDKCYNVRFIELDRIIDELLFKRKDVDSQKRFFDGLLRPDLLVIDEIKYRKSTPDIQEFFYRLIHQRHEQKSTIFTSSKDFSEWKNLLGNYANETINRILDKEYSVLIHLKGEPYQVGYRNVQPINSVQVVL